MVERRAPRTRARLVATVGQLLPGHRLGQRARSGCRRQVGHYDGRLEARHLALERSHGLHPVEVAPAVAVAVDRQQHLGLDLGEAVHHRARAEVGRAARPGGADRGAGEKRRDGLGNVGHVGHHPVARLDADRSQPARDPRGHARAARPSSSSTARAARTRDGSPPPSRPCRGRRARRRRAGRRGTTRRPASPALRARARTAARRRRRRSPRSRPRSLRGPRPTSAEEPRSRGPECPARARARRRSG